MTARRTAQHGFTLVGTLISIVLAAGVVATIYPTFAKTVNHAERSTNNAYSLQKAMRAEHRMIAAGAELQ